MSPAKLGFVAFGIVGALALALGVTLLAFSQPRPRVPPAADSGPSPRGADGAPRREVSRPAPRPEHAAEVAPATAPRVRPPQQQPQAVTPEVGKRLTVNGRIVGGGLEATSAFEALSKQVGADGRVIGGGPRAAPVTVILTLRCRDTAGDDWEVWCTFPKSGEMPGLDDGRRVTVTGTVSGVAGRAVYLDDCRLGR